mmetsp:Transcript_15084/g.41954  ORF Transcript_15084/g.41954 Transcript_15084/m.41954 type:complete len:208 (+) Transcript_15084:112-735(+)
MIRQISSFVRCTPGTLLFYGFQYSRFGIRLFSTFLGSHLLLRNMFFMDAQEGLNRRPVGSHSRHGRVERAKLPSLSTVTHMEYVETCFRQHPASWSASHSSCVTSSTTTWFSRSKSLLLQTDEVDSLRSVSLLPMESRERRSRSRPSSSCCMAVTWAAASAREIPAAIRAWMVSASSTGWTPTGERGITTDAAATDAITGDGEETPS